MTGSRLAIFLHAFEATGVRKNALAIADHMQTAGWQVDLVACQAPTSLEDGSRRNVVVLRRAPGCARRSVSLALGVPALCGYLREARPKLMLSAGNHAHLAGWLASRRMPGTRVVYRLSNEFRRPVGMHSAVALRNGAQTMQLRVIAQDAAGLGLVSPSLLAHPVLRDAAARGRAVVIPNGVDVTDCRRRMRGPAPHPWFGQAVPVALAIGRLAPQKNYPVLLRALAIAQRTRPVRLLVLGDGPAERRTALLKLADKLGVASLVDFAGVVADPFPYLGGAGVFVLPSLWEGASNALLEAAACGVPLVASRSAGNAADLLLEGRYGYLVEPTDPNDVARGMLSQIDPATCVPPGRRAEAFSLTRTMGLWQSTLEQAAG